MDLEFLAQPDIQIGRIVSDILDAQPIPRKVFFVSAFANRHTLIRFRKSIHRIRSAGANVMVVIGIDLDGTSVEALREILSWDVDAKLIKHRQPGHTFHPKIYLFEREQKADLVLGSSNLTEGGFFTNYEGSVHVKFDLRTDSTQYQRALSSLQRFLEPQGPTVKVLTADLLDSLVVHGSVRHERDIRRISRSVESHRIRNTAQVFGIEVMPDPPPLARELMNELVPRVVRERRARQERARRGQQVVLQPEVEITPTSFYMELPRLQGNIPGEARVPLEARDLAAEFWGWPSKYRKETRSGGTQERTYWNWKPKWRIWRDGTHNEVFTDQVRMYEYEASSDFRFYSRRLVTMGADSGDIIRLRRISEPDAEFECVLARHGDPSYRDWKSRCNRSIRNSDRSFGYA